MSGYIGCCILNSGTFCRPNFSNSFKTRSRILLKLNVGNSRIRNISLFVIRTAKWFEIKFPCSLFRGDARFPTKLYFCHSHQYTRFREIRNRLLFFFSIRSRLNQLIKHRICVSFENNITLKNYQFTHKSNGSSKILISRKGRLRVGKERAHFGGNVSCPYFVQ